MKLKKILLPILALGLMVGIGTGISCQSIQPVYAAEEGEVTNPVDDIIQEGEQKEEDIIQKITNFKDTYLMPILGGVSITSVITMIISISLAIANRKTNGKIKESTDKAFETVTNAIKQLTELVTTIRQIIDLIKNYEDKLEKSKDVLSKEAIRIKADLEKLIKMKDEMLLLAEIQAKTLANDTKAVSIGLAEEAYKLVEEVKKLK